MKLQSFMSRFVLSFILIGLALQSSTVLFAKTDENVGILEKKMRQLKKTIKCALTKEGCSTTQATLLRATILGIVAILLVLVGRPYYAARKRRQHEEKVARVESLLEQIGAIGYEIKQIDSNINAKTLALQAGFVGEERSNIVDAKQKLEKEKQELETQKQKLEAELQKLQRPIG